MAKRARLPLLALLLNALILFGAISSAMAQAPVWSVGKLSGEAWIAGATGSYDAVTDRSVVKPGDRVRTGPNGRLLLVRGEESILLSPNSIIGIPLEQRSGLSTTILQQAGTIKLDVEKRNVEHFEVETPYLAAVVKGTQFEVSVERGRASVDVMRGRVEVSDFKTGQHAAVLPGQTANVSPATSSGLSLSGAGTLNPVEPGTPRAAKVDFFAAAEPKSFTQSGAPRVTDFRFAANNFANTPGQSIATRPAPAAPHSEKLSIDSIVSGKFFRNGDLLRLRFDEVDPILMIPLAVGFFVTIVVAVTRLFRKRNQQAI